MAICIYLRPEPKICDLASSYAHQLAEEVPVSLVLDENNLPHITLVHMDNVDDKVDEIWQAAKEVLESSYSVEGPFYLSAIPFPDGSGHNYVRVEVGRSAAFEEAQQKMLSLASDFGAKISNLAGSAWRPHVTMAVADRLPSQLPAFSEVVGGEPWKATPAIGTIGQFRHVDRLLHAL